jgi:hypothetical protein
LGSVDQNEQAGLGQCAQDPAELTLVGKALVQIASAIGLRIWASCPTTAAAQQATLPLLERDEATVSEQTRGTRVATLIEVLQGASLECSVLAGAIGLGREVRRVLRIQSTNDLAACPGPGDAMVYSAAGRQATTELTDHALTSLVNTGASGVLTQSPPSARALQAADTHGVPLVFARTPTEFADLFAALELSHDRLASLLPLQQQHVEQDLLDLAHSGAPPAMVLERLVENTCKTGILQGPNALVEYIHWTNERAPATGVIQQAIRESDTAAQRWMLDAADPAVANLMYIELPGVGLVRLLSPVWVEGRLEAAVSLLSQPAELAARDRVGVVAAARAIALTSLHSRANPPIGLAPRMRGPVAAMVLRAPSAGPEVLTEAMRRRIDLTQGTVRLGRDDVRAWLPYTDVDSWSATLNRWHAQLSEDVGVLTIGHALCRRSTDTSSVEQTILRAAEAALAGERLFGPGQVTSYADAQLAKFLLAQHDVAELRSLYERAVGKLAVEDLKQDSQLVSTLEVYCETFVTLRTAERLGVHRNTVLNRLKRIEEITSADLGDGPTRLLMQFGLLAGRMLRRSAATRSMISSGCESSAAPPASLRAAV